MALHHRSGDLEKAEGALRLHHLLHHRSGDLES